MYGPIPDNCTFDFKKRVDKFYDIAIALQKSSDAQMRSPEIAAKQFPAIPDAPLVPARLGEACRFYWQLLCAYKIRVGYPGTKLANEEKIAALTALAIVWVGPFQPSDAANKNCVNLARNKNFLFAISIIFNFLSVPAEESRRHQGALRGALDTVSCDETDLAEPSASTADLLVFACRLMFSGRTAEPVPIHKYEE